MYFGVVDYCFTVIGGLLFVSFSFKLLLVLLMCCLLGYWCFLFCVIWFFVLLYWLDWLVWFSVCLLLARCGLFVGSLLFLIAINSVVYFYVAWFLFVDFCCGLLLYNVVSCLCLFSLLFCWLNVSLFVALIDLIVLDFVVLILSYGCGLPVCMLVGRVLRCLFEIFGFCLLIWLIWHVSFVFEWLF